MEHAEADQTTDRPPELQPSTGYKLHSPEFYDSLSKLYLTPWCLKELVRRTTQFRRVPAGAIIRLGHQEGHGEGYQAGYQEANLSRLARHGGPDLRDLRGCPKPSSIPARPVHQMSSSGSKSAGAVNPTTSSSEIICASAYDIHFEQYLINHKIYPVNYRYPEGRIALKPGNFDELRQRLQQVRPSLAPAKFPTSFIEEFQQKHDEIITEGEVMRDLLPIICGASDIPNQQNLQFTRLKSITGGVKVEAQPDFYDGTRVDDIDRQVQDDLGSYIIPSGHRMAPAAPNFFLEVKAPRGGADIVKRQALYNGAIGACTMHQLQSYGVDEPVYDGNAYTISATYHAGCGVLEMYTIHPSGAADGTTSYHTTRLGAWILTGDFDGFRNGVTAFRNARVWAQEKRDALILAANLTARSRNVGPAGRRGSSP